jgi:hypothetical protein
MMIVFWDVVPCHLAEMYQHFRGCLLLPSSGCPYDGGLVYETKADRRLSLLHIFAVAEHIWNQSEVTAEASQS